MTYSVTGPVGLEGLNGSIPNLITSVGGTVAGAFTPVIASATGLTAAIGASLAIPVVGGAIAGITLAIGAFFNRKGPQQKVATTKIVNDVEPFMQQNLAAWNASGKTVSEQKQALANFDFLWQQVVQSCDQPQLGNPGKACVNDRSPGGKWDWFSYYRNPIANDPNVQPDPTLASNASNLASNVVGTISNIGGGFTPIILIGLVLAGLAITFTD